MLRERARVYAVSAKGRQTDVVSNVRSAAHEQHDTPGELNVNLEDVERVVDEEQAREFICP